MLAHLRKENFGKAPGFLSFHDRGRAVLVLGRTLNLVGQHMLACSGWPEKNPGQDASSGGHATGRKPRFADDEILSCQFRWRSTGAARKWIFG